MPNWRLATTEADHRTVPRLLAHFRNEQGHIDDYLDNLKHRDDTEEWLLGTPPVGVAIFAHYIDRWVLERLWIKPGYRHKGYAAGAGQALWERRYGKNVGIRQPHHSVRAMLRKHGWGPLRHDGLAEAGLAEPGEAEPFEDDKLWLRGQTKRG